MTPFEYEAECPECGAVVPLSAGDDAGIGVCPVCRARFRAGAASDGAERRTAAEADSPVSADSPADLEPSDLSEADQMAPSVVCLASEQKVNPLAVGPLLEEFAGLERREARRRVVSSGGLLADGVSLDTGRRMVDALAAQGVDAFALPLEWLPEAGGSVRVARIHGADEETLAVEVDLRGTVKTVSWRRLAAGMCMKPRFGGDVKYEREQAPGSVHVVAVGGVGMAAHTSSSTRYKRKTLEPEIEVSLVLRDAAGKAFMMDFRESQVRFGYLGDRAHPSTEQNLAELLGDILRWAPRAFFPAGFRAVAAGKRGRVTRPVGSMERSNYVRWTIACAAARGLFVVR